MYVFVAGTLINFVKNSLHDLYAHKLPKEGHKLKLMAATDTPPMLINPIESGRPTSGCNFKKETET